MERRTVMMAGRRTAYLAESTSWHPTFEVLFLSRGRDSTSFFEEVTTHLAAYGNAFVLDLKELDGIGRDEVAGLLEWTKVTRVRKPVIVGCPASFDTALEFAAAAPQFTLGLAIVPGSGTPEERADGSGGLMGLAGRFVRRVVDVAASLRADEDPDHDTITRGLDELAVPHLDATEAGDATAVAARIRTFAGSIKPSSPARERRPLRPWENRSAHGNA